jgi:hypothetical protein
LRKVEIDRNHQALEELRASFPDLTCDVSFDHPELDAVAEFPPQPGLSFEVSINLQNLDELHLNAGELWTSWFPCGDEEVFRAFIDAVSGVLSGRYRVVQEFVFGISTGAELQRPAGNAWETITGNTTMFPALIPWWRERTVLQNTGT